MLLLQALMFIFYQSLSRSKQILIKKILLRAVKTLMFSLLLLICNVNPHQFTLTCIKHLTFILKKITILNVNEYICDLNLILTLCSLCSHQHLCPPPPHQGLHKASIKALGRSDSLPITFTLIKVSESMAFLKSSVSHSCSVCGSQTVVLIKENESPQRGKPLSASSISDTVWLIKRVFT